MSSHASADLLTRPASREFASQTKEAVSYGVKGTLKMDGKKGKKIFPQHGVATKIGVIDQTRRERSRKEAVERLLGSFGALPNLPTNEEIEGSYEKNHVLNPPRR